jgi:hypothetical protein
MSEAREVSPSPSNWVTVFRCGDLFKADRIEKKLKNAGISAEIPDKLGVLLHHFADLRNPEHHIRIIVPRKDEVAAREICDLWGKPL